MFHDLMGFWGDEVWGDEVWGYDVMLSYFWGDEVWGADVVREFQGPGFVI